MCFKNEKYFFGALKRASLPGNEIRHCVNEPFLGSDITVSEHVIVNLATFTSYNSHRRLYFNKLRWVC